MNDDLYASAIMRRAESAGDCRLTEADASITIDNPLCGDRVTLDVRMDGERIAGVGYRVRGCVLCQASAEVIKDSATGMTPVESLAGADMLRAMLNGRGEPEGRWCGVAIFRPVGSHRSRHDCVLLPFEALARVLSTLSGGDEEGGMDPN